jgi:hypothetical protein
MESIPVAVRALETDTYEFTSNCWYENQMTLGSLKLTFELKD